MYLALQQLKQQEVYKLLNIFRENAKIQYTGTSNVTTRHEMNARGDVTVNG